MKKTIFKNSIIFAILACILLFLGLFFNSVNPEETLARETPSYQNYGQLYYSYESFSNDHPDSDGLPIHYSLRDDYIIYTEQQSALGLCWSFGSAKSLATTIEKATGEYVDFSEAWINAGLTYGYQDQENFPSYKSISSTQYESGSGGWFYGFDMVAKTYGLVLEQDLGFQDAYEISPANASKYYEMYSQYASFNYIDSVKAGRFSNYLNKSNKVEIINSIKNHIMSHGSVAFSMMFSTAKQIDYNSNKIPCVIPNAEYDGGHLMTIIGWDDEITYTTTDNTTYTGAWIVLNSHGNLISSSGNEGIIYVFYDDPNIYADFWGYKYLGNDKILENLQKEEIYYHDEISYSNASFETSAKGAYYGNFDASSSPTSQKNIFFNPKEINLQYNYSISPNAQIKNISIFRGKREVTNQFTIEHKTEDNYISVYSADFETGAYKVLINYGNSTINENHINQFFVCDGTELNYSYFKNNGDLVKNNGYYGFYNSFNVEDEELIIATASTSGTITVSFILASYNTVQSVKVNSSSYSPSKNGLSLRISYNNNPQINITFYAKNGKEKTLKVKLLYQTDETEVLAKAHYSDNGADNGNSRKLFVNTSGLTPIQNPIREGYNFRGWYYSSNFLEKNKLAINENGEYCIEYTRLIIETSPQIYHTGSFNSYWQQFCNVFLYAKWESQSLRTITFQTNGGNLIEPIRVEVGSLITSPTTEKLGFDFIGWFKDISLTDVWNFETDIVMDDTTLYAKFQLKQLQNVKLSLISENAFVNETFTLQLSYDHPLKDKGEEVVSWQRDDIALEGSGLTLTDIVFENKTFDYSARIVFTYDGQSVEASSSLPITTTINLDAITIAYTEQSYQFTITDPDFLSGTTSYTINVYKDTTIIQSFSTTEHNVDISSNVERDGKYQIGVIKEHSGQTMPEVYSLVLEVFKLSYEKVDESFISSLLLKGTEITERTPFKAGYSFEGWLNNQEPQSFPFNLEKNTVLTANWKLNEITSAELSVNLIPKLEEEFTLTVEYEHSIKNLLTPTIQWYRNDDLIEETTDSILNQTLSIYGPYEFYAIVFLGDQEQSVSMRTNSISFTPEVVLSEITISYASNGIFLINDPDNYASVYNIIVYESSNEIARFVHYNKIISISQYITTSGSYSISAEKSFDNQTLNAVESSVATLVKISYPNLTNSVKHQPTFVDNQYSLAQPAQPNKTGYDFKHWTINGEAVVFPYIVAQDVELVAEWTLKPIENVEISATSTQYVNKEFEINLSFEHELKKSATISIEWYCDSQPIETTLVSTLKQTLTSSGRYNYYAIITLTIDGESVNQKSNDLTLDLIYNLSQIKLSYSGNFLYTITDPDTYPSTYKVNVYYNETTIDTFETSNKTIDISSYVDKKGNYNIGIVKSYEEAGLTEELSSVIKMFKVIFINNITQTEITSSIIEGNKTIYHPQAPIMKGYTFDSWKTDLNSTVSFDFSQSITSDTTIYSNYNLNKMTIQMLDDIEFTYDTTNHSMLAKASHELEVGTFEYTWKKIEDKSFSLNNQELLVKDVKDSGNYYCEISFTVGDKTVYGQTNNVQIIINKATTLIDLSQMIREYTYDGKAHTISSGASVDREDDIPQIVYENNSFKDVPNGNVLKLKVTATKTENYLATTIAVDIIIKPAKLTVKVNDENSFWLFEKEDFSYEIVSGTLYAGDSLNEEFFTKDSFGTHSIDMKTNNSNYLVEVIEGKHHVTVIPHIIISSLFIISIVFLSLAIVFKTKRIKKEKLKNK